MRNPDQFWKKSLQDALTSYLCYLHSKFNISRPFYLSVGLRTDKQTDLQIHRQIYRQILCFIFILKGKDFRLFIQTVKTIFYWSYKKLKSLVTNIMAQSKKMSSEKSILIKKNILIVNVAEHLRKRIVKQCTCRYF